MLKIKININAKYFLIFVNILRRAASLPALKGGSGAGGAATTKKSVEIYQSQYIYYLILNYN
ncbi:MAG: hypothetical protein A2Y25_06965 [Candidatus Melainabacteria bacterium GWF2_37_15]|nr:MAG: hypothetical protein A2Y25_06965 [Candidatus Melainabacteria bacterium GWF2_37_15]